MSATDPTSRRAPRRRAAAKSQHGPAASHAHCEGHGEQVAGLNLTPGRRSILDMLCAAGKPLGAYEMIDRLIDEDGRRPAPISVYRALDYLVENGLVHRLATRNAFLACAHGHKDSDPTVFLICETCGRVDETASDSIGESLGALASSFEFQPHAQVIEVSGVCGACAAANSAPAKRA